jgi:predicted ATPase
MGQHRGATMPTEPESPIVHAKPPFLKRVRIRNYKSIAFCDVTLEPLTILVGRNATGKSNFIDALEFLRDIMMNGVNEATNRHGGADSIRCRATDESAIHIDIDCTMQGYHEGPDADVSYKIIIDKSLGGGVELVYEMMSCESRKNDLLFSFERTNKLIAVRHGSSLFAITDKSLPSADTAFAGTLVQLQKQNLCKFISTMNFYSIDPSVLRVPQLPYPESFLVGSASNLASVILATQEADPRAAERAAGYLNAVARSVKFTGVLPAGGYNILEFDTSENIDDWDGPLRKPMRFPAASMSDGTLRAFACLMAVFQTVKPYGSPSLVAIEEPETGLHPAAMRALVAAFDEATSLTQILITTHSPDLLEAKEITGRHNSILISTTLTGRPRWPMRSRSTHDGLRRPDRRR